MNNKDFLKEAIKLSEESVAQNGFPVGAILVSEGRILAKGISNGKQLKDATSHAEIAAIREAGQKIGGRDLQGSIIYSSLEPCLMCLSACYWAGVLRVVFACSKKRVSKIHYEGSHDLIRINAENNRQIELQHFAEFEDEAFAVINNWEKSLKIDV